jgi:hypothetical protein
MPASARYRSRFVMIAYEHLCKLTKREKAVHDPEIMDGFGELLGLA